MASRPITEKIIDWRGGLTDDIRVNFESPRFEKIWNFKKCRDHMIQRYGLKKISDNGGGKPLMCKILKYEETELNTTPQSQFNAYNIINLHNTGAGTSCEVFEAYDDCEIIETETVSPVDTLNIATVPIIYCGKKFWLSTDNELFFQDDDGSQVEVLANEDLCPQTFLEHHKQDDYLYVASGSKVHRIDCTDSANDGEPGACPPDLYMQSDQCWQIIGDRDDYIGQVNSGQNLEDCVTRLQRILTNLGFYTGPVDGIFGPLTDAAVQAFQADPTYGIATGTVIGGQAAGDPLVIDGYVGPETTAALNVACGIFAGSGGVIEYAAVQCYPGEITATEQVGGYLATATREKDGHSYVYLWDLTTDLAAQNAAALGNDSLVSDPRNKIDLGFGSVQILAHIDGDLIAIMSPSTLSCNAHCTVTWTIKKIVSNYDTIPLGKSTTIAEYKLRSWKTNQLGYCHYVKDSRLYFTGKLAFGGLKPGESQNNNEDIMHGIFSIGGDGDLCFEYQLSDPKDLSVADREILGFVPIDDGFVITTPDGVYITDADSDNVQSGFITKVYNGDDPCETKKLEKVVLGVQCDSDSDEFKIYWREYCDRDTEDCGWELLCDTTPAEYEALYPDHRWDGRIIIRRNPDGSSLCEFREIQFKVEICGLKTIVNCFKVEYNMINDK